MKNLMVHLALIALFTGCSGIDWFPASFIITPSSLPGATVGVGYNQTLTASGNTSATFSWTVESGTLPNGLGLGTSTGILSGTPTRAGTFSFTIKVTGANALFATQKYTIPVVLPPSIDQTQLSAAVVNVPYLQTLSVTGGTSPYIWSVSTGPLPTWLTLNPANGTLSGTPDAVGTSSFTILVTDSNGLTAKQTYSLVTTFSINPAQLPNAILLNPYSQTLSATGGTAPYSWSASSLPAWLTINNTTGILSGTPAAVGTSTFTIQVTDSNQLTATQSYSLVTIPFLPLSIVQDQLPNATFLVPYSQTLTAAGGVPPYSWTVTAGSLPSGLFLASLTGTISGRPTVTGDYPVTITVTDSQNPAVTASKDFTIHVL